MKPFSLCVILFFAATAECQLSGFLLGFGGQQQSLLPPVVSGSGNILVFGSSLEASTPSGFFGDLYAVGADGAGMRRLTDLGSQTCHGPVTNVSLTSDSRWAAYTASNSQGNEELHLLDLNATSATLGDRILVVDKPSCVTPFLSGYCPGCTYTCLRTPHVSDDGSRILYAAAQNQPFYVVKSDASAPVNLPVYSGVLAGPAKRVMGRAGQVVFTSSALMGPSFLAASSQVYLMNLDGSSIRQLTHLTQIPIAGPQEATISADGSMIAFTVTDYGVNSGSFAWTTTLYTIRSDGAQASAVASGQISSPSLSADGSLLSYVDNGQIAMLRLGATPVRSVLTQFKNSAAANATISDDGSRIAFTLEKASNSLNYWFNTVAFDPLTGGCFGTGSTFAAPAFPGGPAAIYSLSTRANDVRKSYAPRIVFGGGLPGVPGSLASIQASNLTNDAVVSAPSFPLPQNLAGLSLAVNGIPAPLLSVSPWEITYQIPPETMPDQATIQVKFSDGTISPVIHNLLLLVWPSVFSLPQAGSLAAVFHGNTGTPADYVHPAIAGETLVAYATGLGPTSPLVPAGTAAPANPPATTTITPLVLVGGAPAKVLFSGLVPGLAGVYQANFVMPPGVASGYRTVLIISAGQSGGTGGYIVVQ